MLSSACPRCGLKLVREGERCPACASPSAVVGPPVPSTSSALPVASVTAATIAGTAPAPDNVALLLAPPGYEVLAELGRGGMGVVYRARQVALRREVALKMVLAGVHAGATDRARFKTEAESLARLRHPGIVAIYEVGEHADRPFLCMEYCPGGSLDRRLAGSPLVPRVAAALVQKLALATEAAHQAKVIHRDLKPANVLMTADGEPRISDFGLARQLDDQGQTQTGTVMGSPSYMSPEQARGEKTIGPQADVYALGAVLYECVTGRPPFKAATTFDTLAQVLHDEPVPPTTLNAKVPRDLETICLKCLRKEVAKRYASAQELADDLGRWLKGEPIAARPVGRLERASKWVRRNPAVAALSAAIALLLIVGMAASTLFALDARREAARANEKAEEADRERREAERARQEAEREKAAAQQALAEVERTLIEGLLRPIGKSGPAPSAVEVEALGRLAGMSDDRRVRFVEMGLETAESARRLGRRAEWVAQAVVGLDRGRRERVVALVTRRWREPGAPREVVVACVLLAAQLDVRDPALLLEGLAVVTPLYRDAQGDDVTGLNDGLSALAAAVGPGDVGAAAAVVLRAAEAREARVNDFSSILPELRALLRRLPPHEAAPRARRAADEVLFRMGRETGRESLYGLAGRLKELLELVPPGEAAARADQAVGVLVGLLRSDGGAGSLYYLCSAVQELAPAMSAASLRQASDAARAALRRGADGFDHDSLVSLLERLLAAMPEPDRTEHAGRAVAVLLAALEKGAEVPEPRTLARALGKLGRGREGAARAAGAVLAALEKSSSLDDLPDLANALLDLSPPGEVAANAERAAERILAVMEKTTRPGALYNLGLALRRLAEKVGRPTARRIAEGLITAAARLPTSYGPGTLLSAVRAAAGRLPPGEAARYAGRAAEAALVNLGRAASAAELDATALVVVELRPLFAPGQEALYAPAVARALRRGLALLSRYEVRSRAAALKALAPGLPGEEAERTAADVLTCLKQQPDGDDVAALCEVMLALAARHGPDETARRAGRLAPVLTAALAKATTHGDALHLVGAVNQLAAVLPPAEAARVARAARAALVGALPQMMGGGYGYSREEADGPAGNMALLLSWLETRELVRLLEHPLMAREPRRAVLAALKLRTRVTFRNAHHVLAWAESNGVDLRPAGR